MKKNKKGFTLAELLIVVAIIAVLTAIAVPLFMGSLNKAKDSVKAANVRAVRGAAVVCILESEEPTAAPKAATEISSDGVWKATGSESFTWTLPDQWVAVAEVTANGEIKDITLTPDGTGTEGCVDSSTNKGGYTVTCIIKANEVKGKAAS